MLSTEQLSKIVSLQPFKFWTTSYGEGGPLQYSKTGGYCPFDFREHILQFLAILTTTLSIIWSENAYVAQVNHFSSITPH
jgi:hypothetical protein